MSMTRWAENEIKSACKKENPNWDGKSFDYGCSCYQSALKAYKSLMEDDHSGFSFSVTKNILIKLLNGIPLSPITDDDFFSVDRGTEEYPANDSAWLKEKGLKSDLQCPRHYGLFRQEDLNGNVTYKDIDRVYCINAECPSDTFSSGCSNFIDDLYPITMPYMPSDKKFKVYVKSWLSDKNHGDYDVHEIIGYEDQEGNWHDYNLFEYYGDNDIEIITDKVRKMELYNMRVDTIEKSAAAHIYNDIIDHFVGDLWQTNQQEEQRIVSVIKKVVDDNVYNQLIELCKVFVKTDEHGICYLNTWHNHHIISKGDSNNELYDKHPELLTICQFINDLLEKITEKLKTFLINNI